VISTLGGKFPHWKAPLACAAVALAISGIAVLASISPFGWNLTVLVRMSGTEPMAVVARLTDPSFIFVDRGAHNDGVYYYAIARDPLALGLEHGWIDQAAYRYGHAGYGWLAWFLSAGQPGPVPAVLLLLNLVGIAIAAGSASVISKEIGWSPWGGLAVALSPGLIYAVTVDTAEPVGAAVLGLTILAWLHRKQARVSLLLVLLCFIKEPFLLVPVGLALWEVVQWVRFRRRPNWRLLLALVPALLAFSLWQAYVHAQFGVWSFAQTEGRLRFPLTGWAETFRLAASMGVDRFDRMQIGQAAVPILAAVGGVLALGMARALHFRTFLDPIYLLFALLSFCMTWEQLLYPKDLIRLLSIPCLFLPAVLLGQPAGVEPAMSRSRLAHTGRARMFVSTRWLAKLRYSALQPWPWIWPYGVLALVLALVMWSAWFSGDRLISGGDTLLQYYPTQYFLRQALSQGEFPFWNPYTFSGVPAFANLNNGFSYPLHWALLWMHPIQGVNWLIGIHVVLAGIAAAWCAGRLGASKDGQFVSGVAFALGSAAVSRIWSGALPFVEVNAWLAVATGLATRILERRTVVYLALAVALLILAGQAEIYLFCLWWLPLFAALSTRGRRPARLISAVLLVGSALALGLGLVAFQILPFRELISVSFRQGGISWDVATGWSLPPWQLLEVLSPTIFGDPRGSYWPDEGHHWHEQLLYVGIVPLLAAAMAGGRWRWACWGLAGVAIALAFGRYAPWYAWFMAVLPGYSSFRVPSKHLTLAALALALAAGLGIQRLRGRAVAGTAIGAATLLFLAGVTSDHWLIPWISILGGSDKLAQPAVRAAATAFARSGLEGASVILAVAAVGALLPTPWSIRSLILLATLELTVILHPFRINRADPNGIVAEAQPLSGQSRAAWVGGGGAGLANYGPLIKVTQPAGYSPLFSVDYGNLVTGADQPVLVDVGSADNPVLPLLGYSTIVDARQRTVTTASPPAPRAWVARCVWPGGTREVRSPDFPRHECITRADAIEREPPVPAAPASILSERYGWQMLAAEGPGWLVTSEPWYPGWTASIDGQPAVLEPVDGALVGVELPAGAHTITISYRPAGLTLGLLISIGSGLLLAALVKLNASGERLAIFLGSLGRRLIR
jgi:hypothetical protein